jgi:hypothetical protein
MVSQAVASVDAWLAQAEEVLRAQRERGLSPSSVLSWDDAGQEWVLPLARFEHDLEELLERLCRRPGRWILIATDNERHHRYWQALAFEDGSLVTEVVGNHYLEGEDRWTPEQESRLLTLGWECPRPPRRPNWINVEYSTSPPVDEVAKRASATLRRVFGLGAGDHVFVTLLSSPLRGDTPAAALADTGTDEPVLVDDTPPTADAPVELGGLLDIDDGPDRFTLASDPTVPAAVDI